MVFFVLKGGVYALRYLRYKQLSRKIVKMSLVDKELKDCFWDVRPKNKNYSTFHSRYRIFESLLFEGYSCKRP